jgi:hypothetical protein
MPGDTSYRFSHTGEENPVRNDFVLDSNFETGDAAMRGDCEV